MDNKSLHEFSTLNNCQYSYETWSLCDLEPVLITMVQATQFCGKAHEDTSAYLQHFLEIYNTFTIKGVIRDAILLFLFTFLLLRKAK
jgi:hypothetical protein